jgi:tetratricopeptide (TPR) repeat protein
MKKRVHAISIIFILVLILFLAAKQLISDFYCRKAHYDRQELDKAIGYLEKCVAIDNGESLFHFFLGRAYLRKGLAPAATRGEKNKCVRKSIDEFHGAINLNPVNSDYHFHLGIGFGSLAYPPPLHWELIQNSFRRTAMLNPTDIRHLYSTGIYYLNEYGRLKNVKQNTESIGPLNYKKYAALSRDNYELYFKKLLEVNEEYLGKILDHCFLVTQTYPDLRRVIRNVPNDHTFLARFLIRKGMWEEAKKEFQLAIEIEPNNPIHYSNYAHTLFRRGDFRHAVHWWQKQKVLDPRNADPYLSSVDAFVKLKRFDEALRELRDLMVLYPENIKYRIKLIRTLLAAGRLDEAIAEYHDAMEKDQNFSKEMYDSIRYYQEKGNYPKATRILNETLSSALRK